MARFVGLSQSSPVCVVCLRVGFQCYQSLLQMLLPQPLVLKRLRLNSSGLSFLANNCVSGLYVCAGCSGLASAMIVCSNCRSRQLCFSAGLYLLASPSVCCTSKFPGLRVALISQLSSWVFQGSKLMRINRERGLIFCFRKRFLELDFFFFLTSKC